MREKWGSRSGAMLYLSEEEVDYLIANVRSCHVWSGRRLYLLTRNYYGGWHLTDEAVEILSDEKLKDRFTRCHYQLDTRDIRYEN